MTQVGKFLLVYEMLYICHGRPSFEVQCFHVPQGESIKAEAAAGNHECEGHGSSLGCVILHCDCSRYIICFASQSIEY